MSVVIGVTLGLLAGYLLFVVLLGYRAHQRRRITPEDYFLANRGIGKILLVGTLGATLINGLAITGTPALFYEGGILFGQMFIAAIGCVALLWAFGPRVNDMGKEGGYITPGELFAARYRSRTVLALTALFGLLAMFPFLAIQIAGIGKVISAITDGAIQPPVAILLCTVFVGIYIFLGGARATIWTDALQGLIAMAILVGSSVLFVHWSGGIPEIVQQLKAVMPEKLVFNSTNTPLFIDNILSWTFAFFLWPHIFQRMFMAQSAGEVRQTANVLLIIFPFLLGCLLIMSMAATAELYGTLDDPDQLIATMYQRHLPLGAALLTIMIFALAMSTIDSMLLALGASATRDVARGLLGKQVDARAGFTRGRWLTLGILVLAMVFAMTAIGRGAILPWVTLGASIATLNLWPFVGIFVFPGSSAISAIIAMTLGFLALFAARFTPLGEALPFGFATASFLAGGFGFAACEVFFRLTTITRNEES